MFKVGDEVMVSFRESIGIIEAVNVFNIVDTYLVRFGTRYEIHSHYGLHHYHADIGCGCPRCDEEREKKEKSDV